MIAIITGRVPLFTPVNKVLDPIPSYGTGHRLWELVNARTGATHEDYRRAFHRYALVYGNCEFEDMQNSWDLIEDQIVEVFDRVVFLGVAARRAARLLLPDVYISESIICIPQPTSSYYLKPVQRGIVEVILEELYVHALSTV